MKWIKETSAKPEEYESVLIIYRILICKINRYWSHAQLGVGFYSDSVEWSLCDIDGADSDQKDLASYDIEVSFRCPIPSEFEGDKR